MKARTAAFLAVTAILAFFAPAALPQFVAPAAAEIRVAQLPREARETLAVIRKGGPYSYAKDGVVFGNREARLPKQKRGYYREYTVKTPGERTRGARRIVAGLPGEYWYTDDHYATFRRIRE
ncbi:MAG: ribonuclease [Betaproteobacteria bacterium]|nr:ribonuclease [Betaproteobacteria bacterium]